jgi:fatty acid synthase, animal type
MGLRASMDASQREEDGILEDVVWPSKRTVLIRADKGVASQPYAKGASRLFDLDNSTSDVELHELHGSHFGILNPNSGLAEILNEVLHKVT